MKAAVSTAGTVLALALLCLSGGIAIAQDAGQDPKRGQTVEDRPRGEWQARGMRMGGFLAYPKIGLSETLTDNVYATKEDTSSDLITAVTASFGLESNFSRHELNFDADAEVASYADNPDEDYQDFGVATDGRVDVTGDLNATAGLGFDKNHEKRSSPDDAGAVEPAKFTVSSADVGVSYKPNRLSIEWDARAEYSDYDDVETAAGVTVNNDDRDRAEDETSLRLGYQVHPGYEGFLRGTYGFTDYADSADDGGANRDSNRYALDVGVTIDLTGIIEGDVFVGYMRQSYDDAAFQTSSGISAGAEITWIITPLTTLNGSLERKFNETTATDSSGYVSTDIDFGVEHELLRNLVLKGNLGYGNDAYDGISRTDDRISGGLEASYLLNRNVHATLSYSHQTRNSTDNTSDFSENKFTLRFLLQI